MKRHQHCNRQDVLRIASVERSIGDGRGCEMGLDEKGIADEMLNREEVMEYRQATAGEQ